jgi:hypothetical protein
VRITHVPHLRDARTAHVPQSRDALTREFLIGVKIDHAKDAKDANPTTLQTRFAEELRRAPRGGRGEKSD